MLILKALEKIFDLEYRLYEDYNQRQFYREFEVSGGLEIVEEL